MIKYPENQDNKSGNISNASFNNLSQSTSWFHRLGVGKKIGFGYGIAIGVGVLGTVTGTFIGDYHQHQAIETERHVDEEVELFNELKSAILQARTHQQQFIPLLETPEGLQEEYTHFLKHAEDAKEAWGEMQSFVKQDQNIKHSMAISKFLKTYEGVPQAYFEQVDKLIEKIDLPNLQSPQQIQTAQKLLLDFTNSSLALKFDEISDELSELSETAEEGDEEADLALVQAQKTRRLIVFGTNLISIALAVLFAYYTTKMIARPIKKLTEFADEVTRESKFDLQIPVMTDDEVGVLTNSLNDLILRVKHLLKEQAEAK